MKNTNNNTKFIPYYTCIIILFCFFAFLPFSFAIVYVNKNATGANNGNSWTDAHTIIQAGIDDADVLDEEVWVAKATYYEKIVMKPGVAIYGGFLGNESQRDQRDWQTNETIIDGGGNGHTVTGANDAILDGFTIQNGNVGALPYPNNIGGGIFINETSPQIINCIIRNNTTQYGGGIGVYGGSSIIQNCTITGNTGAGGVGGIYCWNSSALIEDCSIINNNGRGINCNSSAIIQRAFINNNTEGGALCRGSAQMDDCIVTNNTGASEGGGIYCGDNAIISGCTIQSNSANWGGGLYTPAGSANISNCWIEGNSAQCGGGIRCNNATPIIEGCVFVENNASYGGGAIYCESSSAEIVRCTLYGNTATDLGGGIVGWYISPTVNTCILWNNSPDQIAESVTVNYSNVQDGYIGTGNIYQDPLFVNTAGKDFHLQVSSPCIDMGDPSLELDPDGTRADIGAYYYPQPPPPEPDIYVNPLELDFGTVQVGSNKDLSFSIGNSGGVTLTVNTLNIQGTDSSQFSLVSPPSTPFDIGAGGSQNITIQFSPTIGGVKNANVRIESNDPDENPLDQPTLLGTGGTQPDVYISQANLNFGNLIIGNSKDLSFIIGNNGNESLTINQFNIQGTDSSHFSLISPPSIPFTINPDESQGITVRFQPTTEGVKNANIHIESNDPDENPLDQPNLTGRGIYQLILITSSLPDGTVDVSYSETLSATGGLLPYTWSISSGNLPPGLSLNSSTGLISGAPTTAGTFTFMARVRDSLPQTSFKWLSISVSSGVTMGAIYVNANNPSATFNLTGPTSYSGSVSWSTSSAPTGSYTCTWNSISGYSTPPSENKTLSSGGSISFYGIYTFQTATITGQVTDSSNGSGIANAFVNTNSGGYQTYTNSSGNYTLSVSPGTYTLTASKSGYNSNSSSVSIAGGETKTINLALNPVPTSGNITGKVTNSATGAGIVNCLIISTPNNYQTYTDGLGNYNLTGVLAGTYTLVAKKGGYISSSQNNVVVTAGSTVTRNFSLVDNGIFKGTITQPINGTCTNSNLIAISASASDPESGVDWVRFYLHHGSDQGSNSDWSYDGFWCYKTDYSSPYSVSWNHSGFLDGQLTLTIMVRDKAGNLYVQPTSERVKIFVDRTQPETTITSGPPANVNSPNVWFNWTGSDNITATSSLVYSYKLDSGSWSTWVSNLTKSYTVSVGSHTFYVKAKDLAGNDDATPATCSFTYSVAPTTGQIQGQVIDAAAPNHPIPGAKVLATGSNGNYIQYTNSTGNYTLSNIPAGTYTIIVSHNNYDSKQRDVILTAGETKTENFTLIKKVSYGRIKVTLPDGTPVANAEVKIIYPWCIQIDYTDPYGYVNAAMKLEQGVKIHAEKCLNEDYDWYYEYRKKEPITEYMYKLWMDSDIINNSTGEYSLFLVNLPGDQVVPLIHPIFKWNLFVKVQKNLSDYSFTESVVQKFRDMAKDLYNATDGYMMLNNIYLFNHGRSGFSKEPYFDYYICDYDGDKCFAVVADDFSQQFIVGIECPQSTYIIIFRNFSYKDYLHEFGHYALSFGEEHESYGRNLLERVFRHPKNYGLMDCYREYRELSSKNDYLFNFEGYLDEDTDETAHLYWYRHCNRNTPESCWDTFKEKFGKPEYGHNPTQVPLYQYIKTPYAGNGFQKDSPQLSIDYDRKGPQNNMDSLVKVYVNDQLWGGSTSNGSEYGNATLNKRQVLNINQKTSQSKFLSLPIIYETKNQIFALNGNNNLPGFICSVALDDITSTILVTFTSSSSLEFSPSIIFIDDETLEVQSIVMIPTGNPNEYSGSLSISSELFSGTLEITTIDTEGNISTLVNGFRLNKMSNIVPETARSREGFEILYIPVESSTEGEYVVISSSQAPVISPNNPELKQVSNAFSVQVTTSTYTFDSGAHLNIPYSEFIIKGKDESTAKIYCFNELTRDWDVLTTNTVYSEENMVSSIIDKTGIYAVFAIDSDDTIAPSQIGDLTAIPITGTNEIELTWTASGDDDNSGTAYCYELRYSEEPIDADNWANAIPIKTGLTPQSAGSTETYNCWMSEFDKQYYFVIIAKDEASNCSPVSNCASAKTSIVDEDGDGMPDRFEEAYGLIVGTDDSNEDPDADGLTNIQEYQYNTNPNSADTDGDGLSDYDEIFLYQTDPNKWDSDGGGESDGAELSVDHDPWNSEDDDMPPSEPVALNATRGDGFIELTWTSHPEADVIGYEIYYGTSSGGYIDSIYVGNTNSYTLTNVTNTDTYYITYTAKDSAGKDSFYAPEIIVNPYTIVKNWEFY